MHIGTCTKYTYMHVLVYDVFKPRYQYIKLQLCLRKGKVAALMAGAKI